MPTFFIVGQGLTPLKIGTEWFIILVHLATLGVLWQRRAELVRECVMALAFAVALSAVSELFFTMLGIIDKDGANGIGHLYKVMAYLYLFHATFNEALRRPLERMEVQHLREKVILNAAPDGVLWVDAGGNIQMANPAMAALSGYPVAQLLGQNVDMFLPQHLRAHHGESVRQAFSTPHPRPMGSMDLPMTRRDGSVLPVDISLGYFEDEGNQHAICYIRDLSERKKFEASLKYQATHDELTSLPNRWLFHLQLRQSLTHCERTGQRVAVLFVDLDDFKNVNDSFGHPAGDALLVQVSVRMRQVLRDNDLLARLGGDEFAVLLTHLDDADEAGNAATRLLLAMQDAYRIDGHDIYTGASMGIAFFPDDARDSDTLLRFADMAMYQSKAAGRGTYSLFSKELDQRVHEDMALHTRLKEAITSGGLALHYQPQVDVQTGQIVAAEALLRWHDAVLGQVSPVKFIPVAEMTGLILPLSDWVLNTACQQIASWMKAGQALRVAINVTAQQFRQRDLPQKVAAALQLSGADAQWLDIEITESAAMSHPEQTSEQLNALVALGCRVALDDFGTGYSSLSYLKAMPVNKIKIDKSFMDGVPHDANDVTISQSIIGLAKNLGLGLVAEGVENEAQLDFLRVHGCETYQGWLFAKAMPAEELENRLKTQRQAGPVWPING
jgi:diguanylate cyclase (GGDEF)-like protein/PAS domain S-box-containing protein